MSYYIRLSLSLHIGQSRARPPPRVTLILLSALNWSPLVSPSIVLYEFPFVRGVVDGETIDNINFLLIWISIINSASSTCCTFSTRFPLTKTQRTGFPIFSINHFCYFHLQYLVSSHLHQKRRLVFFFFLDDKKYGNMVTVNPKYFNLELKKCYSELRFPTDDCTYLS